ncbi:MAG: bifunctional folylpolyglutamate synthase/dihydrofolate synthase [Bacteroidales bacterium OttesenSCG-928-I14]|nr:bifunctional folylpolyglutamate synthase/dihydrofolate synthase [Bacteroidales bacterium OttesenSCG-928-I14]
MTYTQTIKYIYNVFPMFQQIGNDAYKKGLKNSILINKYLNYPCTKYKTIHIAGTNGKGSTAHLLASILQESGYKVGLYTSPHILDLRERIKINGIPINKNFVIDFIARYNFFFESINSSFFELTTGMAFYYFAKKAVNIAIIEVGLGGKLDCTNIITPVLSIITNISYDHTNILGNTLTKISKEKAGIIKPNIPVIIGEAKGIVKKFFLEKKHTINNTKFVFAQEENIILFSKLLPSGYWKLGTKKYPNLINKLGGYAQIKNATTTLCAINILKQNILNIPSAAVYKGFFHVVKNTGIEGRWQILQYNPKIILDTGHNIAGIKYVVQQLKTEKYNKLHIIFGMVSDKNIMPIIKILPKDAIFYFTQANIPRALNAKILMNYANTFNLKGRCYFTVAEAFTYAKYYALKEDVIFIGGSTFVVAEALLTFRNST